MSQKISNKRMIAKNNKREGRARMSTIGGERIEGDREWTGGTEKREGKEQWM